MTAPRRVLFDLGPTQLELLVPPGADILTMGHAEPLPDPAAAIAAALAAPVGTPPLREIIRAKLAAAGDAIAADAAGAGADAVIVISDNTRPVPYRGPEGILWPIVAELLDAGVAAEQITVLVATGTHRPVTRDELATMLDPRVLDAGVRLVNHESGRPELLEYVGTTARGTDVAVNRLYTRARIKVLTGLVESHFMAGASGGRKAIFPGLIGDDSTFVFHGAAMLASSGVRDLALDGNPCHEEALAGARLAGADFIVNVTLDRRFRLTGVFAGELDAAHRAAVARLVSYAGIPLAEPYDIVVTHAGRVGINHYQAAKAGLVGAAATRPGGRLVLAAHHTDIDPIGTARYRTVLHLLKLFGADAYERLLLSPDWQFVPDQWEPQMWAKALRRVPEGNLYYCASGLAPADWAIIPARQAPGDAPTSGNLSAAQLAALVESSVAHAVRTAQAAGTAHPRLAYLADGPYGVPLAPGEPA